MAKKFLVVGHVIVDVLRLDAPSVNLGGAFHAVKGFVALACDVTLAYIAPSYLDDAIKHQAKELSDTPTQKIGEVIGCPNIVLVREPTEAGDQGYEYLLEKERRIKLDGMALETLLKTGGFTDVLVFPDSVTFEKVLRLMKGINVRVHIDCNFDTDIRRLGGALGREFESIMLSTSAQMFQSVCGREPTKCRKLALRYGKSFLLKENRGGSRFWRRGTENPAFSPAFISRTVHSVGVGDCFDAAFISLSESTADELALRRASLIASEYAGTLSFASFRGAVQRLGELSSREVTALKGTCIAWEDRASIDIYLAAPDFRSVDTSRLSTVEAALKYHNFTPHRPVQEHGEIEDTSSRQTRLDTASRDIALLLRCQILIAVPIYDDPGTYIEMGYALKMGIPVLVYEWDNRPKNLLAQELPTLVTNDLEELISEVFNQAQSLRR